MTKRTASIIVAAAITSLSLVAYSTAGSHGGGSIEVRKNGMAGVGAAMGVLAGTAKGQMEFNPKAVMAALKTMNYVAATFDGHFPAGSETGGDTTASPKIWEDMAGFKAALVKFEADTSAAIAAAPGDQAALGAIMGSVGGNCKACHEVYRIKKN